MTAKKEKSPASWRIRAKYGIGNTGYLVRHPGGKVTFVSKDETPLGLNFLVGDAAALRYALEDEQDGDKAVKLIRDAMKDPNASVELLP